MPSNSIFNNALKIKTPTVSFDAVARQMVFAFLSSIKFGRLTVFEGTDVHEFGDLCSSGDLLAQVVVEDAGTYSQIAFNGTTGAGEAYMKNQWHTPDLLKVVRLFVANMQTLDEFDSSKSLFSQLFTKVGHWLRKNTLRGSKENIIAHYDLSNEFFALFLDESMMYSAAIFPHRGSTLEQAAQYKLRHVCERLQLTENDHLLEIGTGWGSLAIYAAQHYGCKVTTTTISEAQYAHAKERVECAGLHSKITLLQEDYRQLSGSYDKLVSIEMIEAVGHEFYRDYFRQCGQLLKPDGLMLIQSITIADQRYDKARNDVDFIKKYIFPGGCLPSVSVIAEHAAAHSDMQIVALEDITEHYARTLAIWRQRFHLQLDKVKLQGFDETFVRMWEYYLAYCEGGFIERTIGTSQFLMAKPGFRQLPTIAPL
ncbi:MAG: class I SAM-dependent methyltransferase [Pseudomonadales bacterium]